MSARTLVATMLGLAALAVTATSARAGVWMQVSCVNPDGSAAPSEGWSGFSQGNPGAFAYNDARCAPGKPMTAILPSSSPAAVDSSEWLQYAPPAGSTLVGGTVNLNLAADGYGQDSTGKINAVAKAALFEPSPNDSPSNLFLQCVAWLAPCPQHSADDNLYYSGPVTLPSRAGGDFFAEASCSPGDPAGVCNENAGHGGWALVQINAADLLLQSNVSPQGANFSGSVLQNGARGTAHLVFTARDPGGPGVYAVTVAVDGKGKYSGTPNTNGGACVSRGTDPGTGALMFDDQQPCLRTETVDVPVSTSGLPDGPHQLSTTVYDAAGNVASVRDQTIHTFNPQYTPVASRGVRAQFVISWRWLGKHTTLRLIRVRRLPRRAHVSVRCRGRGCPRLKVTSVGATRITRLLDGLRGRRFAVGDRLLINVSAPRRRTERIELRIRDNRSPEARLIRR
jgi:hypothetical protein